MLSLRLLIEQRKSPLTRRPTAFPTSVARLYSKRSSIRILNRDDLEDDAKRSKKIWSGYVDRKTDLKKLGFRKKIR